MKLPKQFVLATLVVALAGCDDRYDPERPPAERLAVILEAGEWESENDEANLLLAAVLDPDDAIVAEAQRQSRLVDPKAAVALHSAAFYMRDALDVRCLGLAGLAADGTWPLIRSLLDSELFAAEPFALPEKKEDREALQDCLKTGLKRRSEKAAGPLLHDYLSRRPDLAASRRQLVSRWASDLDQFETDYYR